MSKAKEILMPVLVLGVVCLVVTALLGVTNFFTAPIIAANQGSKTDSSRKVVLADGDKFTKVDLPESELTGLGVTEVYKAENGAGYAITTAVVGYHGEITSMFGIDPEGKIVGLTVLSHTETKGLGERIADKDWQSQFIGKSGTLNLVKGTGGGDNDIAALAGATISSTAMTTAANSALAAFEMAKGA
ncbi:electron transport complex protein RnfG [Hydrogenoanaerobacterium saccharovorans]|uniref:Ion-translocating oxidoreductase complex subunit G n=1 Tax=Hydrogenoanaerobacterium saccharovorans TaxID=474960 RepID=A0A1H7YWE7_9FIRM|nr:RnfABCDGE type electron transport complex subunit G [Hydrogenoanaerobacterium saccharovorans]RPF48958.1 electron transport complex protein RnfG [Hydrogenoanaerobacterium saccharovorans]SEM50582.1 electron transport complex protein RnfG [Hydrogenoanaerobacterium saccharovorans]